MANSRWDYDEKNEPDEDEPFDPKTARELQLRRDAEDARVDSLEVQAGLDQRRARRVLNSSPGDPDDGLSGFDQNLLELSAKGMSLQEISDEIGGVMTPADVHVRVRQIVGARSWLGYLEKQSIILLGIMELVDHTRAVVFGRHKDAEDNPVFGSASWADLLRKLWNDVARMTREYQVDAEKIRTDLTQAQSRMMIDAIDRAFVVLMRQLKTKHPDIDEAWVRAEMGVALSEAIRSVDKHTSDR